MNEYAAPVADVQFLLKELMDLPKICALSGNEELSRELASQVLTRMKITTARFFADHVLPLCPGHAFALSRGAESVLALDE